MQQSNNQYPIYRLGMATKRAGYPIHKIAKDHSMMHAFSQKLQFINRINRSKTYQKHASGNHTSKNIIVEITLLLVYYTPLKSLSYVVFNWVRNDTNLVAPRPNLLLKIVVLSFIILSTTILYSLKKFILHYFNWIKNDANSVGSRPNLLLKIVIFSFVILTLSWLRDLIIYV